MDQITVTMLGPSGSGKTTYLHGMYAHFALGNGVYGLFERDWDRQVELDQTWRELSTEGMLPAATDENPQHYQFVLQHGGMAVLDLHWADFRGGALFSRAEPDSDVEALRERLVCSDSIHVVLDGGVLADTDSSTDLSAVAGRLGADRMSTAVRHAIDQRRGRGWPPPSLVVMITKADRLLVAAGTDARTSLDNAVRTVLSLLPIIREGGLTAMVCPVQVGWFGRAVERVDPALVAPEWLHQPILFTARHHFWVESQRRRAAEQAATMRISANSAELRTIGGRPLARLLERGRREKLQAGIDTARETQRAAGSAAATAEHWVTELGTAIAPEITIFHQGVQLSGNGHG